MLATSASTDSTLSVAIFTHFLIKPMESAPVLAQLAPVTLPKMGERCNQDLYHPACVCSRSTAKTKPRSFGPELNKTAT